MFPCPWGAEGTRWGSEIFRHRRVSTRKLGEIVKPVSRGKGGGSPGCDGAGVRWFSFRFLTVCHVWWRGNTGPESMGSFCSGGGVIRRACWRGNWEECGGGDGGRPAAVRAP